MVRSREQRQVLAELELTSTARAHAFAPFVTSSSTTGTAPSGDDTPAAYWRARFDAATTDADVDELVRLARSELTHIRRRTFPALAWATADELAERVVDEGEGVDAPVVAMALRCTPTFVRRARLARGRDTELGRVVRVALEPRALVDAGMSLRQVSAVLGGPPSTLHERLARAA
jgi:hypothetical protein